MSDNDKLHILKKINDSLNYRLDECFTENLMVTYNLYDDYLLSISNKNIINEIFFQNVCNIGNLDNYRIGEISSGSLKSEGSGSFLKNININGNVIIGDTLNLEYLYVNNFYSNGDYNLNRLEYHKQFIIKKNVYMDLDYLRLKHSANIQNINFFSIFTNFTYSLLNCNIIYGNIMTSNIDVIKSEINVNSNVICGNIIINKVNKNIIGVIPNLTCYVSGNLQIDKFNIDYFTCPNIIFSNSNNTIINLYLIGNIINSNKINIISPILDTENNIYVNNKKSEFYINNRYNNTIDNTEYIIDKFIIDFQMIEQMKMIVIADNIKFKCKNMTNIVIINMEFIEETIYNLFINNKTYMCSGFDEDGNKIIYTIEIYNDGYIYIYKLDRSNYNTNKYYFINRTVLL